MMRTNFHLRGEGGMILDDLYHRAEVMRRGNALEGIEDVLSARDPRNWVLILDHCCIGTNIKLFFCCFVLCCLFLCCLSDP